ncbi:hypothetical protein ACXJY6_16680 [Vibrio sp. RC27]
MKLVATLILLCLLSVSARADQPLAPRQFEDLITSCLPGGVQGENCLIESLLKFTKNKKLRKKLPSVVGGLFDQIIGSTKIFAVHPVQSKALGDFIIEESYIIEKDNGRFALLKVAFLKTLGVWQVHNVKITSKGETINKQLGVSI